jgi:AcrR family transcriptional regulator
MVTQKLGTDVRKKQIAQAALSLVSSHGLKGLSIAGIASQVGLVPSAIYRHFKNKEQIIDAILDLIRERLLANVKVVTETSGDVLERLRWLLMLHIQLIRENQGILRVVFSEEVMNGPPERKARVHTTVETYLGAVAEIVRQGQEAGVIQRDLETNSVSVAFLGLIQPAAILWHLSTGKFDLTGHTERAWMIFLVGIASKNLSSEPAYPGKEE